MGGGNPIKHVVVLMLENRSFDHMCGYLKQLNPDIDGLNGNENNPLTPTDPNSERVTVTDTAGYVTKVDPNHSVASTITQLWGTQDAQKAQPPMDGFVYSYNTEAGESSDKGAAIMECFNSQSVPAISTLATSFAICDRWYASIPGPTQPNRMFLFSATSDGAATNVKPHLVAGYPQQTIFDNLYEAGHSIGLYYSDFPGALIMRHLRERKYWSSIKQIQRFYNDCASGTLPAFSFLEPRWFSVGDLGASDQHPPHDVSLGDVLIANVYEAIRASPLWERTLFIVTYDEHGGFYDHVPTPLENVPNPDGKTSSNPPFDFERLGVRVPTILCSPWITQGTVINEPDTQQVSSQPGSRWEHSSVAASLKNLFGLPNFLTKRDAWAATFDSAIISESRPRTDCPLKLPLPPTQTQTSSKIEITHPLTDELLAEYERKGKISHLPLSDLQYEILTIAKGITHSDIDVDSLKTEHEGALFVREQLRKFFAQQQ